MQLAQDSCCSVRELRGDAQCYFDDPRHVLATGSHPTIPKRKLLATRFAELHLVMQT